MLKACLHTQGCAAGQYARTVNNTTESCSKALAAMADTLYSALSHTHHCEQVLLWTPKPGCSETPSPARLNAVAMVLDTRNELHLTARLNLIACLAMLYTVDVLHQADPEWTSRLPPYAVSFDYAKETRSGRLEDMADSLCIALKVDTIKSW